MVSIDSVRVQNFRSIVDSDEIKLDSKITTLVGPNEAGKTNFLAALRKFETEESFSNDDLSFYIESSNSRPENIPIVSISASEVPLDRLYEWLNRSPNPSDIDNEYTEISITKYFDGSYDAQASDYQDILTEAKTDREQSLSTKLTQISTAYQEIYDVLDESDVAPDVELLPPEYLRRRAGAGRDINRERMKGIISRISELIRDLRSDVENNDAQYLTKHRQLA
jgi:predicted ATP-dependent endonuclease of OLD family